ncbi:nuclear factor interleukin-3-regulated protein-like [Pecten maximus]|uniref:nuclear factor interleukin-3-regulated protein-like n=1 Tax=Pecten maximus TaxID=6579 RepID=UPI001458BCF4|nr:nuclear factor interleukin-3-regulated protein-like [Pecten maximus]
MMSDGQLERPSAAYIPWDGKSHRFEPIIISTNSLRGMAQTRQAKRVIPDTLKDEKYWERRKKNNIAAKRSRENRRRFEIDVRLKLEFLEKENILLKKEVSVMKLKFGIPLGHSILSDQEKLDCINDFKKKKGEEEAAEEEEYEEECRQASYSSEVQRNCLKTPENQYSGNYISSEHEVGRSSPVCYGYEQRTSFGNSPDGIVWSTGTDEQPQIKQNDNHHQLTIEGFYKMPDLNPCNSTEETHCHCVPYQMGYKGHEQGFYLGANRKQTHVSANLYLAKSRDFDRNGGAPVHISTFHGVNPNSTKAIEQGYPKTEAYRSISPENSNAKLDRQDLRRKIMQLSAQCEEMRDLVFKT